jgi:hypothetical protein
MPQSHRIETCNNYFHIKTQTEEHSAVNFLTLFGLFAVTAMLVTYALESRSTWFILAFAASCMLGSVYGFMQGAWPFGVVEAIWSVVALRRWYGARR